MRYTIVSTFILAAGFVSTASADSLPCNPAVQNWQNGSRTTCPYDAPGGGVAPPVVYSPAPRVEVVDVPSDISEELVD